MKWRQKLDPTFFRSRESASPRASALRPRACPLPESANPLFFPPPVATPNLGTLQSSPPCRRQRRHHLLCVVVASSSRGPRFLHPLWNVAPLFPPPRHLAAAIVSCIPRRRLPGHRNTTGAARVLHRNTASPALF
jgi:hypothetical protein